jgi:hypothetical protein
MNKCSQGKCHCHRNTDTSAPALELTSKVARELLQFLAKAESNGCLIESINSAGELVCNILRRELCTK